MGTEYFSSRVTGDFAEKAFDEAKAEDLRENGTNYCEIATKDRFVLFSCPADADPEDWAEFLVNRSKTERAKKIQDRAGPAGCIKIRDGEWLFFGLVSC